MGPDQPVDSGLFLAVGDIHGRSDLLGLMLEGVLPTLEADRRLVFLGDYIDRGPDSAGVLTRLMALQRRRPDTVFLLGNHERLCLDALDGQWEYLWLANGGQETLDSFGLKPEELHQLPAEHVAFLRSLELYHETDDYLFVHAGVRPGVALSDQRDMDLIWIREVFFQSKRPYPKTVIFGHTPFAKPLNRDNIIGIDTGAVYGGKLTCLALPEREFRQF